MRALVTLAFVSLAIAPAFAAEPADPGTIAWNNKIAMNTPGIDGVFVVQDDGSIRHVQSGMICPATFDNVKLWHLENFPSKAGKGMDVSCDYGRNGPGNRFVSKLTLFATIAPDGWTLDDVYRNYRSEVMQANPGARSTGPAKVDPKQAVGDLADYKSEQFLETRDGRDFTSELIVSLRGKWMFEVRATYDGKPNTIGVDPNGDAAAQLTDTMGDRVMAAGAYVRVAPTLPK
jgi:hypothetical protein